MPNAFAYAHDEIVDRIKASKDPSDGRAGKASCRSRAMGVDAETGHTTPLGGLGHAVDAEMVTACCIRFPEGGLGPTVFAG